MTSVNLINTIKRTLFICYNYAYTQCTNPNSSVSNLFYFVHACNIRDILTMLKDRSDQHSLTTPPTPHPTRDVLPISTTLLGTYVNIKGLVRVFPCDK